MTLETLIPALAEKATGALLGALARQLRQRLSRDERKTALEACSSAGVTALVAAARPPDADHETQLADVLEEFFGHPDLGRELQALVSGGRLHVATLMELFEEAGYDPQTLPGLDLAGALGKFEVAFVQAAVRQEVLQGEITAQQALIQSALLEEILEEVRRLQQATAGSQQNAGIARIAELLAGPTAPIADLREAYLHRLVGRIEHLPLGGVDPTAARTDGGSEVRLAPVYTALLTRTPEEPEPGTLELRQGAEGKRALSALELLDRERCLVLLGEPGSGKTTFVRFVALCLAGEVLGSADADLRTLTAPLPPSGDDGEPRPQPWNHGPLLPVPVVLRDLAARGLPPAGQPADGDTLWRFLEAELGEALEEYAPALKGELHERGALVLLDGLDEVPEADARREQIKAAVEGFADTFPRCRFLVTSRTYAYQREAWKLSGFAEAVLAPFEPWQVRRFVEAWYAHVGPLRGLSTEEAEGQATLLVDAIASRERLAELAPRPLLLTLMASLHASGGGNLPEEREALYARAVELLLERWERPKVVQDARGHPVVQQPSLAHWLAVDRADVRRELERLAFEVHRDQPQLTGTADLPRDRLVGALIDVSDNPDANPAQLVKYLKDRAGLLVARGETVYAFPHRTFQEYLAACHLTRTDFPYTVARLGRTDPERWREVVLLAGAKVARGTPAALWLLVDALCPEAEHGTAAEEAWGTRLAGEALVESGDLGSLRPADRGKLERLRVRHAELLRGAELPSLERAGAGRVLGRLGDARPGVTTISGMELCRVPAGDFCWGESEDEAEGDGSGGERRRVARGYWISRFPVTVGQYGEFVAAGGYREGRYWEEARQAEVWEAGKVTDIGGDVSIDGPEAYGERTSLANHPVVGVTWYEAVAFTRWLTLRLREAGLPEGWAVRLPSEVEWEMAARGGLELPAAGPRIEPVESVLAAGVAAEGDPVDTLPNPSPRRGYPWGDEAPSPEHANHDDTGLGSTSAVGCFPRGASPVGCEELAGSVWEWCRDVRDGEPTDRGARVALRGGSWFGPARYLAAAVRFRYQPTYRFPSIGFRVVLSSVSEHA